MRQRATFYFLSSTLGFAKQNGGGWESNPPGAFADATPGLKPVAVTRAAYTPKRGSIMTGWSGKIDRRHWALGRGVVFRFQFSVFGWQMAGRLSTEH